LNKNDIITISEWQQQQTLLLNIQSMLMVLVEDMNKRQKEPHIGPGPMGFTSTANVCLQFNCSVETFRLHRKQFLKITGKEVDFIQVDKEKFWNTKEALDAMRFRVPKTKVINRENGKMRSLPPNLPPENQKAS